MQALLKRIAKGDLDPIYCLVGSSYPRVQLGDAIKQQIIGNDEASLNYDRYEAKSVGAQGILRLSRTPPMFGDRRLVVVPDIDELKADELAQLVEYVDKPSPFCVLVLSAEKIDQRVKFFARIKKAGWLHKFEPLKDRQVPRWLDGEAKHRKIKLAAGASQRIAEAVGTDMAALADALERLVLFVGEGKPIRPADVEEVLAQTKQHSIFELTDAIGARNRRKALLVLYQMQRDREPALRMVAMLARHVRQLWSAKEQLAKGLRPDDLAKTLGMHPYVAKTIAGQCRKFDIAKLDRMHRALHWADMTIKSTPLSDVHVLNRVVFQMVDA